MQPSSSREARATAWPTRTSSSRFSASLVTRPTVTIICTPFLAYAVAPAAGTAPRAYPRAAASRRKRACDPRRMHEPPTGSVRRARLATARLYLVLPSARASSDLGEHDRRLVRVTRAAIAGGADVVQLREK